MRPWRESLWRGIGAAITPLVRHWLHRRIQRGKEDATRLHERFGRPVLPRPAGKLIWAHAASVGEAVALLPLLRAVREARPDITLLLTTGTVTSAALVARQSFAGLLHQFVPVDIPSAVDGFLDHWRPDLALWSESELWPGLLAGLHRRGVKLLLLQGRMSARSASRWQLLPGTARWLLGCFDAVYAQTAADAERFRSLGARHVQEYGNLKQAAPPLGCDDAELARLRDAIDGRPRWLLASSHPGDEAIALQADRTLRLRFPDLLTIIAPRHPERGQAIAEDLRKSGARVALRSVDQPPETEIYVADTLGEMGLWYRLCPLALMGGSLIPHGGQNPLEPARLGAAVLFGPHMFNFSEASADLLARNAALQVQDGIALAETIAALLADPARLAHMGEQGRIYANEQGAVLTRLTKAVLEQI